MSFLPTPLEPVRPGLLRRVVPVTRLAVAAAWLVVAFVGVDPRAPGVLLVAAVAALATLSGLPLRASARRLAPLVLAAAGLALLTLVLHPSRTDPSATVIAEVGPLRITAAAASAALALALRLALIAVTTLLVFGPSDPTTLADSLVQQWHVPDRFAYGTLAALRIAPFLASDWSSTRAVRRLRGIEAGGPAGSLREAGGRLLTLLVSAVRRAERMALAMDARGFDAGRRRTHYRPMRAGVLDAAVLLAGIVVAGAALWVATL
jgi:energy-coupling factor transport system permease protein